MLSRENRLTHSRHFDIVYKYGTKYRGKYGMAIFLPPDDRYDDVELEPRIGLVVGKKVGNAVTRNLHKRRLRMIFRDFLENTDVDLVNYRITYIAFEFVEGFALLKADMNDIFNRYAHEIKE